MAMNLISTIRSPALENHVLCAMGDTDVNKTRSSASKGLRVRGRGQTYPPKTSIIQTIPQERY